MTDFMNAQIYCLDDVNGYCYVGSTNNSLDSRLSKHLSAYKAWLLNPNMKHCSSVKLFDAGNVSIRLLEKWPCFNRTDLEQREAYWIKRLRHDR